MSNDIYKECIIFGSESKIIQYNVILTLELIREFCKKWIDGFKNHINTRMESLYHCVSILPFISTYIKNEALWRQIFVVRMSDILRISRPELITPASMVEFKILDTLLFEVYFPGCQFLGSGRYWTILFSELRSAFCKQWLYRGYFGDFCEIVATLVTSHFILHLRPRSAPCKPYRKHDW